jgi:hypothetical protein
MAKQSRKAGTNQPSSSRNKSAQQSHKGIEMPFGKDNFILMGIGFGIIVIGYILMSGDTNIYSFRKITLAPLVVMFGYAFEAYAIMKTPKHQKNKQSENNES